MWNASQGRDGKGDIQVAEGATAARATSWPLAVISKLPHGYPRTGRR